MQILFGILLLFYVPHLDPYPNYIPLWTESLEDTKYEALLGGEHVCPERESNILSSKQFSTEFYWCLSYQHSERAYIFWFFYHEENLSHVWYIKNGLPMADQHIMFSCVAISTDNWWFSERNKCALVIFWGNKCAYIL